MQYVSDGLEFKSREYAVDPMNHILNRVPGESGDTDGFPQPFWYCLTSNPRLAL